MIKPTKPLNFIIASSEWTAWSDPTQSQTDGKCVMTYTRKCIRRIANQPCFGSDKKTLPHKCTNQIKKPTSEYQVQGNH